MYILPSELDDHFPNLRSDKIGAGSQSGLNRIREEVWATGIKASIQS